MRPCLLQRLGLDGDVLLALLAFLPILFDPGFVGFAGGGVASGEGDQSGTEFPDFSDRYEFCGRGGFGDCFAVLPHAFQVKFYGLTSEFLHFFDCLSGNAETRQIRSVCAPTCVRFFVDDEVFHFSPACLRILFNVPGGMSTDGCPATVTVPGFVG